MKFENVRIWSRILDFYELLIRQMFWLYLFTFWGHDELGNRMKIPLKSSKIFRRIAIQFSHISCTLLANNALFTQPHKPTLGSCEVPWSVLLYHQMPPALTRLERVWGLNKESFQSIWVQWNRLIQYQNTKETFEINI